MEGIAVLNPAQQTRIWREGYHGVTLYMKATFKAFGINRKQCIDETEELHNPFVLTKIFVTYQAELDSDSAGYEI